MARAFHANGPSLITIDGQELGYSTAEGVELKINKYMEPVYSDLWGPSVPHEVQSNGCDAIISFTLAQYDAGVLNGILAKRDGGTAGRTGLIGELMYLNSRFSSLSIASPRDDTPYQFYRVVLLDDVAVTLSTQVKRWTLVFKAYPDASGYLYN